MSAHVDGKYNFSIDWDGPADEDRSHTLAVRWIGMMPNLDIDTRNGLVSSRETTSVLPIEVFRKKRDPRRIAWVDEFSRQSGVRFVDFMIDPAENIFRTTLVYRRGDNAPFHLRIPLVLEVNRVGGVQSKLSRNWRWDKKFARQD